jgi:hypothetical protein
MTFGQLLQLRSVTKTEGTLTSVVMTSLTSYLMYWNSLRSQGKSVSRKDGDIRERVERRSSSWTCSARSSSGSMFLSRLETRLFNMIRFVLLFPGLGSVDRRSAKATAAATLFVACSFDFSEILQNLVAGQIVQADIINSKGLTALQVAVNYGSCEAILILISNRLTQITEDVAKAAAENWDSGKEVMTLLLQRRRADVPVIGAVVIARAVHNS